MSQRINTPTAVLALAAIAAVGMALAALIVVHNGYTHPIATVTPLKSAPDA